MTDQQVPRPKLLPLTLDEQIVRLADDLQLVWSVNYESLEAAMRGNLNLSAEEAAKVAKAFGF